MNKIWQNEQISNDSIKHKRKVQIIVIIRRRATTTILIRILWGLGGCVIVLSDLCYYRGRIFLEALVLSYHLQSVHHLQVQTLNPLLNGSLQRMQLNIMGSEISVFLRMIYSLVSSELDSQEYKICDHSTSSWVLWTDCLMTSFFSILNYSLLLSVPSK